MAQEDMLSGDMRLDVVDTELCVGCQMCMFACSRIHGDTGLSRSCILVKSLSGMERGFKVVVCRACLDPPCARVCPVGALTPRKGGCVRLDETKCIGCGHCKEACAVQAVFWDSLRNKPLICRHCGYCANYCPHGVLAVDKRERTYTYNRGVGEGAAGKSGSGNMAGATEQGGVNSKAASGEDSLRQEGV